MMGPETCDPKSYRPVFFPSAKSKTYRGILLVCAIIHLILAVMLCFIEV